MTSVNPEEVDNFLAHFGVKGMHWGRRRVDVASTVPSRADRKIAKKQFAKAYDVLSADAWDNFLDNSISEKSYASLSDKDTTYKKGKEFYRVELSKYGDRPLNKTTYVSDNQKDRARYRATIPNLQGLGGQRKYKPHNEIILQATKDIKSPSEKARIDAFSDLIDTPSIQLKNGKTVTGREYLRKTGWASQIKQLDSQEAGRKYYKTFTSDLMSDTPINTAYYNSLRKKGYDALIDDNDAKTLSDTPLIILDTKGAIKKIGQSRLSNQEITDAQKEFTIALQDEKKR